MNQDQQSQLVQPNNSSFYSWWTFLALFPLFYWIISFIVSAIAVKGSGMIYVEKLLIEFPALFFWELILNIVMIIIRKTKKIELPVVKNKKIVIVALLVAIGFEFISWVLPLMSALVN